MSKQKSLHLPTSSSDASVHQDKLANGLKIVTDAVPYVQSGTLGIQIDAGSRDDPEENQGLAHFIEHALFKGTGKRSYIDIARNIEKNGGYLDAFTTKEQTCISTTLLKNLFLTSLICARFPFTLLEHRSLELKKASEILRMRR